MSDNNQSALSDFIMTNEDRWCKIMGYFNPYLDPFTHHLQGDVPVYDSACYERYPEHNYVYDKLWVAQSQELAGGTVVELIDSGDRDGARYPLFVKPRWGHKTSGSKHCRKVSSPQDLPSRAQAVNQELIWSEYLPGREGMTDFVLVSGRVVYQMTHVYSTEQKGFADVWKHTSPDHTPPGQVQRWVEENLSGFTGIANVQYRDGVIIEVGLRPARTGAYFAATDNGPLLRSISRALSEGHWGFEDERLMRYTPFYSFKCHTQAPIVYTWPQHLLDLIMMGVTTRPFYEYYPEPTGREGMVFLQFMHDDLEEGKIACSYIEKLFTYTQWAILGMWIVVAIMLVLNVPGKRYIVGLAIAIYASQLLNPMSTHIRFHRARQAQRST